MTQFDNILNRVHAAMHKVFCEAVDEMAALFRGIDKQMAQAAYSLANETKRIEQSRDLTQEGRRNRMQAVSEPFEAAKARYEKAVTQACEISSAIEGKIFDMAKPIKTSAENRLPNIQLWQLELAHATPDEINTMYRQNADDKDFHRIFATLVKSNKDARNVQITTDAEIKKAAHYQRVHDLISIIYNVRSIYMWELPDILGTMKAEDFTREGMLKLPLTHFERMKKWENIPGFVEHRLL